MNELTALFAGILAGLVVVVVLVRSTARAQIDAELTRWRSQELYSVRREALDRARPEVQRRVGSTIASWTHSFPFRQEDARFIGHPIDYVVFEGYSEVRARREDAITRVTFVRARSDGSVDPDAELVRQCVAAGRVEWRTLEVGGPARP